MRHRLRSALVVVVPVLLAACGSVPQPFHSEIAPPLTRPRAVIDVAVVPPAGAPPATAAPLAEALATALGRHDIQASTQAHGPGRYRVVGTAEPNADAATPYVATITWTLEDDEGAPIGLHSQGVLGSAQDWHGGSAGLIAQVADEAAAAVAVLIDDAEGQVAAVPGSLRVMPVRGAPGDGDETLTGAMRRALLAGGFVLADEEAPAAYRLVGTVGVAPPEGSRQAVRIVWQVIAADGATVGRASQENVVAAGSLDGRWGRTADAVAAAALPGIAQILRSEAPGS